MAGNEGSFFSELKRRNVYRVGIAYIIASWLLLQVIDVVDPIIGIPEWVPKLILVILAVGLPLALFFAWAYEMTPEGLKREKDVDRSQSITDETGLRLNRMIIGILVVAVGVLLVDRYVSKQPDDAVEQAAAVTNSVADTAGEVVATGTPSIAVLPFANMSADESSTYFSDGLADTLLHMLAQIREIRVAARTSSFQFRDQNTDITKIAEALNVGTVLEGSVQRAGNKIRVTAQLIEADSGYHLWSGNFDRDLDDVFAIQDEIANEVVAALKVSLLGESVQKIAQHDTDNIEAYTEYLLGVDDLNKFSFGSLPNAEQHFKNAVALDPEYAQAWAQLGNTYLQMQETGLGVRDELLGKAGDAASKAMQLDKNSAIAITVLGTIESMQGNDEIAEQLFQRAIEAGPNETLARLYYAGLLGRDNRLEESERLLLEAFSLDPLSIDVHNFLASHYKFRRMYDEALRYTDRVVDINPLSPVPYYRAAEIEYMRGNLAAAVVGAKKALDVDPDDPEIAMLIGDYYVSLEMPDEAKQWYDRSVEIDPDHAVSRAAPLVLDMFDGEVSADSVKLARQLLEDDIEDRQGSHAHILLALWIDAARNDTIGELLTYLQGFYPESFEAGATGADIRGPSAWFIGALMVSNGQEEQGRLLLESTLENTRTGMATFGVSSLGIATAAIYGNRDETLELMREYRTAGVTPDLWSIRMRHGPNYDFIRDEPEYRDLMNAFEENAAEQREVLKALAGEHSTQQKRGPT